MTAATHEHASPHGYIHRKDDYLKRLRRIEGQARGLQKMVEDEKYCIDILTQVSAMTKALQSVALGLLDEHLSHCVVQAAQTGGRRPTRRSGRPRRPSPDWSAPDPARDQGRGRTFDRRSAPSPARIGAPASQLTAHQMVSATRRNQR